MKKVFALLLALGAAVSANAGTSVGVSIDINQPGVYGRINIGNVAPPMLLYPQPVIIVPSPVAVHQQPIYLYVPPGHQKNWARHCARYRACGQPVYFVQEQWVRERYEQHRQHGRDEQRGRGEHERGHQGRHGNKGSDNRD